MDSRSSLENRTARESPFESLRVILVEDHTLLRESLKCLFATKGEVQVVAESADAEGALACVDATPCDAVIVDISLPGQDGIWCTRMLKEKQPDLPVLIMTMHLDERMVIEALEAGASGYVHKSITYEELVRALREICACGSYIHPKVAGAVVNELRSRKSRHAASPSGLLSRREQQILVLAGRGLTNREIGTQLTVAESTVKTHLRSLYRKFSVSDRNQAILHALREGILPEAEVRLPREE